MVAGQCSASAAVVRCAGLGWAAAGKIIISRSFV